MVPEISMMPAFGFLLLDSQLLVACLSLLCLLGTSSHCSIHHLHVIHNVLRNFHVVLFRPYSQHVLLAFGAVDIPGFRGFLSSNLALRLPTSPIFTFDSVVLKESSKDYKNCFFELYEKQKNALAIYASGIGLSWNWLSKNKGKKIAFLPRLQK